MKRCKVVIKKSKNKQFYFVILSSNGHVFATSETYTRPRDAKKAARSMLNRIYGTYTPIVSL